MFRVQQPVGRALKRSIDIVCAAFGLILLAPLFATVAAFIRAESPGPVFFRQVRVGRDGREFRIWKFRSMVADAGGAGITMGSDQRVTRVGAVLRRWKIDELPQLLNVLGRSMSLVGPRAEVPEYVKLYDTAQRNVLRFRPGITDPASLQFRHEETHLAGIDDPSTYYVERLMPEKIRLNLEYQARATVLSDLSIIIKTLRSVAAG